MANKPKILSNDLDQISKVGKQDQNELNNSEIHNKIIEVFDKEKKKEVIEKLPKLEKENFRIDSSDWKEILTSSGKRMKINSLGDILEYVDGVSDNIKGEQMFTFEAAKREATKVGKKMVKTSKDYKEIIDIMYNGDIEAFREGEKIKFTGRGRLDLLDFYFTEGGYHDLEKKYPKPYVFHSRCEDGSVFFYGGNNSHVEYDTIDEEQIPNLLFSVRLRK